MKKSDRRWWTEGKTHIKGKELIRAVAEKYGASCAEEIRFPIDLHEVEPELWPKKSIRGYQADLLISKRRGKQLYEVIAEVDGEYHQDRKLKDMIRDKAIPRKYGIKVVRFNKEKLLAGGYSDEEIASKLGI